MRHLPCAGERRQSGADASRTSRIFALPATPTRPSRSRRRKCSIRERRAIAPTATIPHASAHPGLPKTDPVNICLGCHSDIADLAKKTVHHQPAFVQGCAICHEPHGGDNEHLLRAATPNSCAWSATARTSKPAEAGERAPGHDFRRQGEVAGRLLCQGPGAAAEVRTWAIRWKATRSRT